MLVSWETLSNVYKWASYNSVRQANNSLVCVNSAVREYEDIDMYFSVVESTFTQVLYLSIGLHDMRKICDLSIYFLSQKLCKTIYNI